MWLKTNLICTWNLIACQGIFSAFSMTPSSKDTTDWDASRYSKVFHLAVPLRHPLAATDEHGIVWRELSAKGTLLQALPFTSDTCSLTRWHTEASKQVLGPQFSISLASQFAEADCIYSFDELCVFARPQIKYCFSPGGDIRRHFGTSVVYTHSSWRIIFHTTPFPDHMYCIRKSLLDL